MIQTLVVILIVAVAVWYLYRWFAAAFRAENGSCGCGGCAGCPAECVNIQKDEKNRGEESAGIKSCDLEYIEKEE